MKHAWRCLVWISNNIGKYSFEMNFEDKVESFKRAFWLEAINQNDVNLVVLAHMFWANEEKLSTMCDYRGKLDFELFWTFYLKLVIVSCSFEVSTKHFTVFTTQKMFFNSQNRPAQSFATKQKHIHRIWTKAQCIMCVALVLKNIHACTVITVID